MGRNETEQYNQQPITVDDVVKPLYDLKEENIVTSDVITRVRARAKMMEQYLKQGNVQGYKASGHQFQWEHSAGIGALLVANAYLFQIPFFLILYGIGAGIAMGLPLMKGKPSNKIQKLKLHIRKDVKKYPIPYLLAGILTALAFETAGYGFPKGSISLTDTLATLFQAQIGP